MKRSCMTFGLGLVCLLTLSVQSFAHHGNASYDTAKGPVVISGTVTEWIWSNPHSFLKMDVKGANGEVQHWVMEGADIPAMVHGGYSRNCFKPGDQISVTVHIAKKGVTVGRIGGGKITLNGKPFPPSRSGDSGDAQPGP
jgi:hypothetical protein